MEATRLLIAASVLILSLSTLRGQGAFDLIGFSFNNDPYLFRDSIELGGTRDTKLYKSPGQLVDDPTWQARLWQEVGGIFEPNGGLLPFYGNTRPGVWRGTGDSDFRVLPPPAQIPVQVRIYDGQGLFVGASPIFLSSNTWWNPRFEFPGYRGFVVPEPSILWLGALSLGTFCVSIFVRRTWASEPNQPRHPTPDECLSRNRPPTARRGCAGRYRMKTEALAGD
jgi:hypothetical protein